MVTRLDLGFGLVACGLLWFRRRLPVQVAAIVLVLAVFSAMSQAAAAAALFTVAVTDRPASPSASSASSAASGAIHNAIRPPPPNGAVGRSVLELALLLALFAWGMFVRARRQLIVSLRDRAERAQSEYLLPAQRARAEEQARIAREMHDVLGHRLSMLALQAGGLELRPDLPVEKVRATAALIGTTARAAVEELRGVIGVLLSGEAATPELTPQPGLDDIPGLVHDARQAGVRVGFHSAVEEPAIAEVGRHAFRIVQEALTNATRHGPGAPVTVELVGPVGGSLTVTVRNPTPPVGRSAATGSGVGLIGLDERVALLGGTFLPRSRWRRRFRGPRRAAAHLALCSTATAMIRVLLVDDDALVRAGLGMILSAGSDIEVVTEVGDGADAAAAVVRHRPNVVLMDIRMPVMDGITATAALRALPDPPDVIVLTTFHADGNVVAALRAGASGFLLKDTPPADILHAVRLVAAGEAIVDARPERPCTRQRCSATPTRPDPAAETAPVPDRRGPGRHRAVPAALGAVEAQGEAGRAALIARLSGPGAGQ